ncbi:MAG: hypothetical protein LUG21_03105 [Clostridiales bacterium]|nr:hypothetical protein [Clostridiales bacterium]
MMKNKEFSSVIILSVIICALFSAPAFFVDLKCGVAAVASDIALIAVFIVYTKKRYKKISELNNYLSLVCAGNYELDINDNAEGELSILKNNLFKIITLLRSSN